MLVNFGGDEKARVTSVLEDRGSLVLKLSLPSSSPNISHQMQHKIQDIHRCGCSTGTVN